MKFKNDVSGVTQPTRLQRSAPNTPRLVYNNAQHMTTPPDRPGKPATEDTAAPRTTSKDGALGSLVRVESLIQLALLLPAATLIGWAIGLAMDHWFKQHWIYIAGLLLGAAAGFVQIFRLVRTLNKE